MKLAHYLSAAGMTDAEFAAIVGGVSEFGVRKWRYEDRTPRPEQMRRIAEVTKGKVKPNDFILFAVERAGEGAAA